jgi:hypothetical protein
MKKSTVSRRQFLKTAGMTAGAILLSGRDSSGQTGTAMQQNQPSGVPHPQITRCESRHRLWRLLRIELFR